MLKFLPLKTDEEIDRQQVAGPFAFQMDEHNSLHRGICYSQGSKTAVNKKIDK